MGRPNHDRDYVVVGATPADLEALGYKNVGESFPVFMDPNGDQYALARNERKTGTGYTGFSVEFDTSVTLEDDLYRRDLTINAMAQDLETGEIVDPYGGRADLEAKVLRHVSDAFVEDPLRVVRLARFYARYIDFTIADGTMEMARKVVESGEMETISHERYWAEIKKVIQDPACDPQRFFEALLACNAFTRVDFFTTNFRRIPSKWYVEEVLGPQFRVVKEHFGCTDEAFMAMIATCSRRSADLSKLPSSIQDASAAWKSFSEVGYTLTAENIFRILSFCRATSRMTEKLKNLLSIMVMLEEKWFKVEDIGLSSGCLLAGAFASHSVTATKFMEMGLSGKELGAAMDIERMNLISRVVEGVKNESQ
jgi:tRNA nucleotidyltransferase/poly(A) polymerase